MQYNHRKKIVFLKLVILLCALSIVSAIIYFVINNKKEHEISIKNKLLKNYDLAIKNSSMGGEDIKGKFYNIESDLIVQNASGKYLLKNIKGHYETKPNKVHFQANNANMSDDKKNIQLKDDVKLTYDGYIIETNELNFDMNKMLINNECQTLLRHLNSKVMADHIEGNTNNGIWKLKGNVTTYIKLSDY